MKAIPKLELYLLGSPQIYVAGQAVTGFNTRKDQALLAYLAVTGLAHSRETLAGLLWSELPEANARRNLRHSLSHLQKVIGAQWLTLARGVALTQAQPWSVDVHTLRTAVKSVTRAAGETRPHPPEGIATLQQVLPLYRGEFLQGFYLHQAVHFEEWVLAQREEVRLLTLRGLEVLVEHSLAQGAYEVGLTATRRLLQLEPWSEAAHSWQMQLLARSGRRAEALAQYERCRHVLATDLGVAPLPATTALYLQLQRGHDPWADAAPPATLPGPPTVLPPPGVTTPGTVLPPPGNAPGTGHPNPPHNLLAPLATFVGRQTELAFIDQRLLAADCRLLTIVGPGGMGKSSLALAAGQHLLRARPAGFPDGIFWVPLLDVGTTDLDRFGQAPADDPASGEAILRAIAAQIGYKLEAGVSSAVQLQAYLCTRRLLLILDNFEHLLAGTVVVITLLTHAPHLKLLLTSRARLYVRGETVLTLHHLSLPATGYHAASEALQASAWQTSEAVAMFVQRAQQLDPTFTINAATIGPVRQICQLVEGLPLGIELATSLLPLLNCTQLASEIAQSLDFLAADMHDLPSDQRTLGAVFERSWRLLAPEGQRLLARLSIFPGSFRRDAAERIAGASPAMLQHLLNQSLLSKVGEDRYTLQRTVHAFAQQKLQRWPEQITALQVQYAHFYLEFLASMEQGLTGAAYALVTAQIQADLDNVRTAWRRAVTYQMVTVMKGCVTVLFLFYDQQGFYWEALELCDHALRHFLPLYEAQSNKTNTELTWLMGRLQSCFGVWSSRLGHFQQGQAALASSWTILQQVDSPVAVALCLAHMGAWLQGTDLQRSAELQTEALRLAKASDLNWLQAIIGESLGETNFLFGDYATAEAQITAGYTLAKQINWPRALISGHKALGRVNIALGRYQQAEEHLRDGIGLARRYHYKLLGFECVLALGETLRLQGQLAEAKACFVESRQLATALGLATLIAFVLWEEGCLAEQCGEYQVAKTLFTESLPAIGPTPWWSHVLPTLGWALIGLGELGEAQVYFQKTLRTAQAEARLPISLDAQVGLAYLTALQVSAAPPHLATNSPTPQPVATLLQTVYRHPAATQETRTRMVKLAAALGVPLLEPTPFPVDTRSHEQYSLTTPS